MKQAVSALLLAMFLGCAPGLEHLDECRNPAMESMSWRSLSGTMVDVIDARTFTMRTASGTLTVSVANVGEPFAPNAAATLRSMLRNRTVDLWVNPHAYGDESVTGEVHVGRRDIAQELLRSGAVSFREEQGYTLSDYSECLHRIAEREAKAQKRGLWRVL